MKRWLSILIVVCVLLTASSVNAEDRLTQNIIKKFTDIDFVDAGDEYIRKQTGGITFKAWVISMDKSTVIYHLIAKFSFVNAGVTIQEVEHLGYVHI
ncbi:MAG: hypothetical protein GY760_16070, partial [Deltaproteobacteria bacterium]|nr:hypothetical protein [Deltaproteobacteria bacterium]